MKFFLIVSIIFSALQMPLHAESFTKVTKIKGLTSGGPYVRLKLDNMLEAEGCKNQSYYLLNTSDVSNQIMFQLLLTAKADNQKVSIQIDGCGQLEDREYPLVTHVYLCKSKFCD